MVFLYSTPPPPSVPPTAIIKQLNNAEDNRPTVGGLQIYATFLHRDAAVLQCTRTFYCTFRVAAIFTNQGL
jgi:hypothetical protein